MVYVKLDNLVLDVPSMVVASMDQDLSMVAASTDPDLSMAAASTGLDHSMAVSTDPDHFMAVVSMVN